MRIVYPVTHVKPTVLGLIVAGRGWYYLHTWNLN